MFHGRRQKKGTLVLIPLTMSLGACTTVQPPDAELQRLTSSVQERASAFFAELPTKAAPACDFSSNQPVYVELRRVAADLEARVPAQDRSMRRAAAALSRTLASAEEAHRLASARTDDAAGPCMTPQAVSLNAAAIARATAAIARLQQTRSQ